MLPRLTFALLMALLCPQGEARAAQPATQTPGTLPVGHRGRDFAGRATADALVRQMMVRYGVPGLSLAISHNDRLVYAAAFGWADAARTQPLTMDHRLRLASCSKPITALALLRLVEQGRLDLDAPVFGPGGVLGTNYGVPRFRGAPARVTVRHLLQHAAGGWGNKSSDPMFVFHDLTLDEVIRRTLAERELNEEPGAKYNYSNFGFAMLGRVIERVTGAGYEAAVRDLVLRPCGAPGMRISSTRGARPGPDETHYFGQAGERPERLRPDLMAAHGGWAANPLELLAILDRVDACPATPELLAPDTMRLLQREGVPRSNYSLGWSVNRAGNRWHLGSMPGSASMVCITARGFNWALLLNTRSRDKTFTDAVDQLVWNLLDAVRDWPQPNPDP